MADGALPRPRPCASCPYRLDVPSGVWDASEYDKLPGYDGETFEQHPAVFFCHQQDGCVCSGWLGHTDPYELLAVRLGVSTGALDPSCMEYETAVPLFASGQEAAEHGVREIAAPTPQAQAVMDKILRRRAVKKFR